MSPFEVKQDLVARARGFEPPVVVDIGVPTAAGILALGLCPQQFFPGSSSRPPPSRSRAPWRGARARNQAKVTGPIPHMLDQAMEWARRTFDTFIVTEADGSVRDRLVIANSGGLYGINVEQLGRVDADWNDADAAQRDWP